MSKIHASLRRELQALPQRDDDRVVLTNRMLTCGACEQLVSADDEGKLATHMRPTVAEENLQVQCVGSYTAGFPHRMLPEAPRPLTFIEIVDDARNVNEREAHLDRNAQIIYDSIHFLCAWLGPQGAPTDETSLIRVAGHANNLQHGALRLMNRKATDRVHGQRRAVDLRN